MLSQHKGILLQTSLQAAAGLQGHNAAPHYWRPSRCTHIHAHQLGLMWNLILSPVKPAVLSTSHPVTVTAREFVHFLQGIPTPKVSLPRVDLPPRIQRMNSKQGMARMARDGLQQNRRKNRNHGVSKCSIGVSESLMILFVENFPQNAMDH